jgi:hypothetical protein
MCCLVKHPCSCVHSACCCLVTMVGIEHCIQLLRGVQPKQLGSSSVGLAIPFAAELVGLNFQRPSNEACPGM